MRRLPLVFAVALALAVLPSSAAAITITEYPIPSGQELPNSMVTGSDGGLWTSVAARNDAGKGGLLRFDVGSKTYRAVPLGADAGRLTNLDDGRFIFNLGKLPSALAVFDPRNGQRSGSVKSAYGLGSLVAVKGGLVWTTDAYRPAPGTPENGLLRLMDPDTGAGKRFEWVNRFPSALTLALNGDLYFALDNFQVGPRLLMRHVTATGVVEQVATIATKTFGVYPGVALRDGRLVMLLGDVYAGGSVLGIVNPATGTMTEIRVPAPDRNVRAPVLGPDGAVWFPYGKAIGRLDPATLRIDTYATPTAQKKYVGAVAAGPDGALWFTELDAGNLGRIDLGSGTRSVGNLATARTNGLGTTVRCSAACTARVTATEIAGPSARGAAFESRATSKRRRTLAKGKAVLMTAGTDVAHLKFSASARRRLKARKLVRLRITQRVRIGGKTVVRRSTMLLRRVKPKVVKLAGP